MDPRRVRPAHRRPITLVLTMPDDDLAGMPEPNEHGQYNEQELLDWIRCRNIERIEALAERYGPDIYAMIRMPWQ
jgi:hypothetical protein